jgi:acetyl/propionyl-CoA carboxylase alpha subunit
MTRRNIAVRRVLVAERGLAARRILRSIHEAELESVAVFCEADSRSSHLDEADYTVPLPGVKPEENYLCSEKLISAAMDAGCDALHPGMGRMAEDPAFAQETQQAGLLWIGLDPRLLGALQDRIIMRELAGRSGLRVIPSANPAQTSAARAFLRSAEGPAIARPVLGRGFEPVDPDDFDRTLERVGNLALQAYGDLRLFLERWLGRARHVTVVVAGDQHGHYVCVGDFESTIRWLGWKIIEEAPLDGFPPALRENMHREAVILARDLKVEGVAAVSFLVTSDGRSFFLNLKPRLPAGHAALERVWGVDLVDAQLRIATGEPLNWHPLDLRADGFALSLRLLALDAAHQGSLASGRVQSFKIPRSARVETALRSGSWIHRSSGPHVATLVFHGKTRQAAIVKARRGLEQLQFEGVPSNREILIHTLERQDFWEGRILGDVLADEGRAPPILLDAGPTAQS